MIAEVTTYSSKWQYMESQCKWHHRRNGLFKLQNNDNGRR